MRWMDCIMGQSEDDGTPAMDTNAVRRYAADLFQEKKIEHEFQEIENAWIGAKNGENVSLSEYYFDIYELRFHPSKRNGYRYLERVMEGCRPSFGYHILTLMLTTERTENDWKNPIKPSNLNNLIVTTNFDNLMEDALFLYAIKRPLVVNHESLAHYIESDIQRPVIAKVHRDLLYQPFNNSETTRELKPEWKNALNFIFNNYTPIVIGYGGGDSSLMSFLEEISVQHGIFWCYRSDLPNEKIQKLVRNQDGCFVKIDGFDALMVEIGTFLYPNRIHPAHLDQYLKIRNNQLIERYYTQWDKIKKNPAVKSIIQLIDHQEQRDEEEREKNNKLTAWDYLRRGDYAHDRNKPEDAITYYSEAIRLREDFAAAYKRRGEIYSQKQEYDMALKDLKKSMFLGNRDSKSYVICGNIYMDMDEYELSLEYYNKAIAIDPNNAQAYNNRGVLYAIMKERQLALRDFNKAVELNMNYMRAYNNRMNTYYSLQDDENASADYHIAVDLINLEDMKLDVSIKTATRAIEVNPGNKEAYLHRAEIYRSIGQMELAEEDEKRAERLENLKKIIKSIRSERSYYSEECLAYYRNLYRESKDDVIIDQVIFKQGWVQRKEDHAFLPLSEIRVNIPDGSEQIWDSSRNPAPDYLTEPETGYAENAKKYSGVPLKNLPLYGLGGVAVKGEFQSKSMALDIVKGHYFDFYDTCESLSLEMAYCHIIEKTEHVSEAALPLREKQSDLFDLTNRFAGIGIDVLTILWNVEENGERKNYFLLHKRSADKVAEGANSFHVVPAGSYQPAGTEFPEKVDESDKTLLFTAIKEFGEELLGKKEDLSSSDIRSDDSYEVLNSMGSEWIETADCKIPKIGFIGTAFDPLNTKTEIMAYMIIDAEKDKLLGGRKTKREIQSYFTESYEGSVILTELNYSEIERYKDEPKSIPAFRQIMKVIGEHGEMFRVTKDRDYLR